MTDIYHSGIKGQRKGVRRFQFANGTYTREGNLRYRPDKVGKSNKFVKRGIEGALIGEAALVGLKASKASTSSMSMSQLMQTALASINANKASIGKAITDAILAVPTPVRAVALPILAVGAGTAIGYGIVNADKVLDKIADTPWDQVAMKTISYGGTAVGVALSTISGNPLPAVAGFSLSMLTTLLEKDN